MPDITARLELPVIAPSQAQKHVTHNEALRLLDGITQMVLTDVSVNTPPTLPEQGALYALGALPTDAWAGQAGRVAQWQDGQWQFLTPQEGWVAWNLAAGELVSFANNIWSGLSDELQNLDRVGIGTTADATNRLALASDASLLTHAGGGHQLKLNKAGAGDTASLLYQSNWSGHAELGLTGDTDFHLKVSPDGSNWTEALVVDAASGAVQGAAVQANNADTAEGKLTTTGGVLAASLSRFGSYYNPTSGIDIDSVSAGFVGLVHDSNSGTWPVAPYGAFVWLWTQSIFGGQAAYQTAVYGYRSSGGPNQLRQFSRMRSNTDGQWGDWQQEHNSNSLVGGVSQSGGQPTGAVIERGANANGEYVRLADGTQMCWCEKSSSDAQNTAYGALYRTPASTVTFPASFAAGSPVQVLAGHSGDMAAWFTCDTPSTTSVQMQRVGVFDTATNITYRCVAIGRWF